MEIATPRLLLRPFRSDDLEAYAALFTDPDFMEWSHRGPMTQPQVAGRIRQLIDCYQAHGFSKWAVIHKADQAPIGYCGIEVQTIDGEEIRELGYRIAAYPLTLLSAAMRAMQEALADFKAGRHPERLLGFEDLRAVAGFPEYYAAERAYAAE